jgi:putative chitinase
VVTAAQIIALAPRCSPAWAQELPRAMERTGIVTDERAAMFLAQCAHESAGFTRFVENLNYSAQALIRTWPKRFRTPGEADAYAHQPVRIANRVYADRLGNGPEHSGDGWRYRGRGCIQITGRDNYRRAGVDLRFPLESMPEEAAEAPLGAAIAAWFWSSRNLNTLADVGDFEAITRRINGGATGLDDRLQWLERARRAIAVTH